MQRIRLSVNTFPMGLGFLLHFALALVLETDDQEHKITEKNDCRTKQKGKATCLCKCLRVGYSERACCGRDDMFLG